MTAIIILDGTLTIYAAEAAMFFALGIITAMRPPQPIRRPTQIALFALLSGLLWPIIIYIWFFKAVVRRCVRFRRMRPILKRMFARRSDEVILVKDQ